LFVCYILLSLFSFLANRMSKSLFSYKIIIICSSIVAKITKINTIVVIVVAILVATNKIKYLD